MSMYPHSETEVQLIKRIEHYVHALFNMDVTGHDFFPYASSCAYGKGDSGYRTSRCVYL